MRAAPAHSGIKAPPRILQPQSEPKTTRPLFPLYAEYINTIGAQPDVKQRSKLVHPSTGRRPLKNVYFMLRCTKPDHKDCMSVCNEAFVAYPGIMEVSNCRVDPALNNRFCVAGRALVMRDNLDDFEEALRSIRTSDPRPVGVSELEVLVGQ